MYKCLCHLSLIIHPICTIKNNFPTIPTTTNFCVRIFPFLNEGLKITSPPHEQEVGIHRLLYDLVDINSGNPSLEEI